MNSEKQIEKKFCDKVKSIGGMALKFMATACAGVPDRIVLLPEGKVYFVELKREGGRVSAIQKIMFEKFQKLGSPVRIISSEKMIDEFIAEVREDVTSI